MTHLFHRCTFLICFMAFLLWTSLAWSQGNYPGLVYSGTELFATPAEALDYINWLEDQYGILDFDVDITVGLNNHFTDPLSDFNTRFNGALGVNIYETTSGSWLFADYTLGDIRFRAIDEPISGQPVTFYSARMFFYNRLPNIQVLGAKNYLSPTGGTLLETQFELIREKASNQSFLINQLRLLMSSPIAKDPFFRFGYREVKEIVLIEDRGARIDYRGSPSQYSIAENTIYINRFDLQNYGFVVLFHEIMQAGLINARNRGVINDVTLNKIMNINTRYFSNIQGYVGEFPGDDIVKGKAFGIGYTYRIFHQYYSQLSSSEKNNADQFFGDIQGNIIISRLELTNIGYYDMLLVGKVPGTNTPVSINTIDSFTQSFTNSNSTVMREIRDVSVKIDKRINNESLSVVIPSFL